MYKYVACKLHIKNGPQNSLKTRIREVEYSLRI